MKEIIVALCACAPVYQSKLDGKLVTLRDGSQYAMKERIIPAEEDHLDELKKVRAHVFVDVNQSPWSSRYYFGVSLFDLVPWYDRQGHIWQDTLFADIGKETYTYSYHRGWYCRTFPREGVVFSSIKGLLEKVLQKKRDPWITRMKVHEVRVGRCACMPGFGSLEGKRIIVGGNIGVLREVLIRPAIGWGGEIKQRAELKDEGCHFFLDYHDSTTYLALCQLTRNGRFYMGGDSALPWLEKRELKWKKEIGVQEFLAGMHELSLCIKKPQQWLEQ